MLLNLTVLPANISDREGAKKLLNGIKEKFPKLSLLWADQGYSGGKFAAWIKGNVGCKLIIANRPKTWAWHKPSDECTDTPKSIQPRRWVVERSIAWVARNRRLAKDYEGLPETEEAFCYLAMTWLMLKRLAK